MGTVEIPFLGCLLCTVYSNSSIIENKMHTEAVCVCVLVLLTKFTFTIIHLADAFIQSDLQLRIISNTL